MFSNNLNGAYEYESERRNDERRAALEGIRANDLLGRQPARFPPRFIIVLVTLLIVLWQIF